MARQRRGECPGNRRGFARGWRCLALAGALLTACAGETRELGYTTGPSLPGRPPVIPGGDGTDTGTGSGSGTAVPAGLVGTWKNVIVIFLATDVQTWTTVWRFDSGGDCRLTKTSFSLVEGFPRTDERACTFTVKGNEIVAVFPATSSTMRMPWDFVGVSPNRLRLEGIEYERIG